MAYEYPSVIDYGLERAADVLSRGFTEYFMPIVFSPGMLLHMVRSDSVDLAASCVMVRDGIATGAALIARRGWTSRLAGMAIVPEVRRTGAGRAGVRHLLAEAKARGERAMVLEVIEQNEPALKLYERGGFKRIRRLVGFAGPGAAGAMVPAGLTEVDLREMAAVVTHEGLPNLPWQLSGESLAQLTPPFTAWQLDGAWVVVSATTSTPVTIRGLVTEREAQGRGRAAALLRAMMAKFPGREWRMAAIWPEELGAVFGEAGLGRTPLSQWQMACEP